jgi:signal transduction histidine kinase
MSDPAEAYLNGAYVGRVGTLPPQTSYSQTYPASFVLQGLKAKNEILLLTRPVNRSAHGMLRSPVGIFTGEGARSLEEVLIGETVVLPLVSAVLMLIFGLVAVLNLKSAELDRSSLRLFAAYALTMTAYLLSLTRIPREYLPLDVAYDLHFALCFLREFFLLGLVGQLLGGWERAVRIVRSCYLVYGTGLLLLIPLGGLLFGGLDQRIHWIYRLSVLGIDFFLPTCLLMVPLSLKSRSTFPYLPLVFGFLALMQLWDTLALHGLVEDIYFVRVYPVPLALSLSIALWQKSWRARKEREIAAELGMVATQVAHDLRAPLSALRAAASSLGPVNSDEGDLITLAVGRLQEISSSLLARHKVAKAFDAVPVSTLVEPVVSEYRTALKVKEKDGIRLFSTYEGYPGTVQVDSGEFNIVISNIF